MTNRGNVMLRNLETEEMALRRRLLFRLLRRFDFDEPSPCGEMISEPVPEHLAASEYSRANQESARYI